MRVLERAAGGRGSSAARCERRRRTPCRRLEIGWWPGGVAQDAARTAALHAVTRRSASHDRVSRRTSGGAEGGHDIHQLSPSLCFRILWCSSPSGRLASLMQATLNMEEMEGRRHTWSLPTRSEYPQPTFQKLMKEQCMEPFLVF